MALAGPNDPLGVALRPQQANDGGTGWSDHFVIRSRFVPFRGAAYIAS
jgi:hypothetical protein